MRWGEEKVREYIKELVIGKCLRDDLPKVFSRVRVGMLSSLLEMFMASRTARVQADQFQITMDLG